MKESVRYILPILVFVMLILAFGTVGYLVIEDGISASDAFYLTVTAITPTQFDEVHELSIKGRYFTVLLVFCGFGAVVAFATQFARLIIQSELEGVGIITRKKMSGRIGRMKNHYIVCGYGEIGGAICSELEEQGIPFVVIANDEISIGTMTREGYAIVQGNPTTDSSLKEAGIERAVGVIAILTDDADNLFIALAARELNPKILIIARGEDSSVEDRMLRAGADIVVSPMKLGGRQIAELVKQQAGESSDSHAASSRTGVMGLRLSVYRHHRDEPTTIAAVLAETGAVGIAGIKRLDGSIDYSPSDATVQHDDAVVLITRGDESGQPFHKRRGGKKILLADDHRALRLLFSRKLAAAGHIVVQASSGEEALQHAHADPPDLVVLDVNMPGLDGYDVCQALRASAQFSKLPIILYSGQDSDEFLSRGLQCGANLCLRKSSKSSELLETIETLIANHRVEEANHPVEKANDRAEEANDRVEEVVADDRSPQHSCSKNVFDLDVAMANVNGDRQLLAELILVVQSETPILMNQMDAATDPLDITALRRAAHKLKGSLMIIGAADAAAAASKLEECDGNADRATVDQICRALRNSVQTLTTALRNIDDDQ